MICPLRIISNLNKEMCKYNVGLQYYTLKGFEEITEILVERRDRRGNFASY